MDHRRAFETLAEACLILDPSLHIRGASNAYLRGAMKERSEIMGRHLFDAFPGNPEHGAAHGASVLRASLERVLATGAPDRLPVLRYDVARPEHLGGGFEERYWSPVNTPVIAEDGSVELIVHRVEDVTAKVKLERENQAHHAALRDLEERNEALHRQLLDTAPDAMIVVGTDGRIGIVNAQTEKIFGYPRTELLGQPLSILLPERLRQTHERHVARFFAHPDSRSMGTGLELLAMRKDGTEFPIEVSLSPLRTENGLIVSATIRDISERKRLEDERRVLSDRLVSAVESMPDAFALFDNQERLVLCNQAYRAMVPIEGDIVGMPFQSFVRAAVDKLQFGSDEERERFLAERLRPLEGDTRHFDAKTPDGKTLRVIDRRTKEGGMVKTVVDLTDDVRNTLELNAAREVAEAASLAKSEFLSSMSHELRTPLNAIMGFAQLMQRDKREPLSKRHQERADHILRGGQHLLRLIDDVLDLSKIEAGRVSISTEPVELIEVLDAARASVAPMLGRLDVTVHVEAVPAGLPMIAADRTRLLQILVNLISNAIKYNRHDGRVYIEAHTVRPGTVRITVRDTGLGIPSDKQHKVFQPFQRAGQENGPIEGTGIGLVISQRLARLMNGDMGFESRAGEGSSFWLDVPAHDTQVPSRPEALGRKSLLPGAQFAGQRKVLYVEDNPANLSFMKDLLSGYDNIELLTAPTAELGIELARTEGPQVVLMDINLPGMDGFEALHALRAHAATAPIPVIALTAAASPRDRQRGIEAGFFRYLTKPVKVDELMTALDLVLAPAAPSVSAN